MRTVEPHVRRARAAVSALFFLNAVLYANLVPRLPDLKAHLHLSNAELGTAIAAMPLGALVAGLLAPAVIGRLGSAKVGAFGTTGMAAAFAVVPHTGSWAGLAALMLAAGSLDSLVDVAQNAHGFRVQRAYGRSIVNGLHAVWSIGAVAGGLLGSAAAGLDVPLPRHLAVSAVLFSAAALVAYHFLLPGPEDAERVQGAVPHVPLQHRLLLLLGLLGALAACEAFVQDAGSSWSALYLRTEVGAGAAVSGLAFVALQVAMTVARLLGDRVTDRVGRRRVVRTGGAVTALGMGLALAVPSVATSLVGFALAGLGFATLVPAVMHVADELPGLRPGVGLTVVSWVLRVGFLLSPSVIGVLADATSLRVALTTAVLAGVVVAVGGRVLSPGGTTAAGPPLSP